MPFFKSRIALSILILFIGFNVSAQTTARLHTSGNKLINHNGKEIRLIGVARPSLQSWPRQSKVIEADFIKMKDNCANVVRVALDEKYYNTNQKDYVNTVDDVVDWSIDNGLYVILDLHHSRAGVESNDGDIYPMADEWSLIFWQKVAARYKDRDSVIFELYNEPNRITAEEVRNGGIHPDGWRMVGFQELYDTIRATGAENVCIIGARHWTYDLRYYETNPINGYNIMYACHTYPYPDKMQDNWFQWTELAKTHPVIMTEYGPATGNGCPDDPTFLNSLVDTMDAYNVHHTAWAWHDYTCRGLFSSYDPSQDDYQTTWFGDWAMEMMNDYNCLNVNASEVEGKRFKIFPNPVDNVLSIENNGLAWKIIDVSGRVVLDGKKNTADVSALKPGLYTIQLLEGNQTQQFIRK